MTGRPVGIVAFGSTNMKNRTLSSLRKGQRQLSSQRLSERVAEALADRLDGGDWAAGQRLPTEHELAATFKVSRTVVREAISRLRQAGRLETIQGSGTFVAERGRGTRLRSGLRQASVQRLVQVLELRRGIESEAAAMAARRRDAAQLLALREALQTLEALDPAGGLPVDSILALPHRLAEATGNPLYVAQLDVLHGFLREQVRLPVAVDSALLPPWGAELKHQLLDEWRPLTEAVAEGDAPRARREAVRHLLNEELRLRNANPIRGAAGVGIAPGAGHASAASSASASNAASNELPADLPKTRV